MSLATRICGVDGSNIARPVLTETTGSLIVTSIGPSTSSSTLVTPAGFTNYIGATAARLSPTSLLARYISVFCPTSNTIDLGIGVSAAQNYWFMAPGTLWDFKVDAGFHFNIQSLWASTAGAVNETAATVARTGYVVTLETGGASHGLVTGDLITVAGVDGPGIVGVDGTWTVASTPAANSLTYTCLTTGTIVYVACAGTIAEVQTVRVLYY